MHLLSVIYVWMMIMKFNYCVNYVSVIYFGANWFIYPSVHAANPKKYSQEVEIL